MASALPPAALWLTATLALLPAAAAQAPDPEAALRAGNRAFRQGDLTGAVETYRRGVGGDPGHAADPVLAYNLGTALHRIGRLPEAVLWYRRAAAAGSPDPWLTDNLERARSDLAAPRPGPSPLLALPLRHPELLPAAAALASWAALLVALSGDGRRRLAAGLLSAGLALYLGGIALSRVGPRPAVLLAPCTEDLPAGSEVWVRRRGEGSFHVRDGSGPGAVCPADAVALIDSPER